MFVGAQEGLWARRDQDPFVHTEVRPEWAADSVQWNYLGQSTEPIPCLPVEALRVAAVWKPHTTQLLDSVSSCMPVAWGRTGIQTAASLFLRVWARGLAGPPARVTRLAHRGSERASPPASRLARPAAAAYPRRSAPTGSSPAARRPARATRAFLGTRATLRARASV